jgi:hypothetical protein
VVVSTPLGQLILDYCWSQRPPLTVGQLAVRLGYNKQTVYNWTGRGEIPTLTNMARVSERTGIPLDALVRAAQETEAQRWAERGKLLPSAPAERATGETHTMSADQIVEEAVQRIMADERFDLATREAMAKHVREVHAGYDPMARHIAAEHAVEAEPASADQPSPGSDQTGRANRKPTTHTRAGPRRRHPPVRKSPR